MTPQQIKELLPIITAFANGEPIEFRNHRMEWEEAKDISFCYGSDSYRIKPKTKKCRIALFADKGATWTSSVTNYTFIENHPNFVKWLTEEIEYPEKI